MKILLVTPKIEPAAMNFRFAMDLVGKSFSHIPLNLDLPRSRPATS